MNNPTRESGIPVLTEVIAPPQAAPAPQAPAEDSASSETVQAEQPQQQAAAEWDEERWTRLEREVRERVLHQVLERIDFVLEQRVRDSLADVLQLAVENLAAEIRSGLHHTVKDVVTRAVTQEISKLQSTKK
ncbi:hypothetical protein [Noviherbaspirillum autotrophicum]|uniref:Uncharacterized protein n=1 Tax=Noviherbaspirillum autotrophicum TaxID=709839 RepID=A0A0C2BZ88_9BURK|nr:hypothetical protein [Noviherbaspirillum autotrophicum]KIF83326.1 hypothetical protein TSA66_24815 [Noviherbaspirillum autotrophicum]